MGESSGAATFGLLVVSKQAKGLFHRAICQSGSAFNHFAIVNDTFDSSRILAAELNCSTSNSTRMIECLRSRDPNWIVSYSIHRLKDLFLSRLNFGPVVENNHSHEESEYAFLDESPEVSYAQGRAQSVPMIIGIAENEGAFFAASKLQFKNSFQNLILKELQMKNSSTELLL